MTNVKHRAKVVLTPRDLLNLLGAPESVHLHRVIASDDPDMVYVMVEHPDLPAVDERCEAPRYDLVEARRIFEGITTEEHYR